MIIDSSPLVAIALDEPGCQAYQRAILQSETRIASAATIFEASVVLMKRYGAAAAFERMDTLVELLRLTIVPFDASDALRARAVYAR